METATAFRDYFEAELTQLRGQAAEFGRDFPATAQALALSKGRSSDPHVELLMQSFAYLAGRLRHQIDQDAALLPNALMAQLYPHLEAPIPSLVIGEAHVRADAGGNGVLERGREFHAIARDEASRNVPCRFTTCYDMPLVPVEILEIRQVSTTAYDSLSEDRSVHSVLKVRLKAIGPDGLSTLGIKSLRFYIDIENRHAWQIYDLLALQLAGVATLPVGQQDLRRQGPSALRWLGFDDTEAALVTDLVTHPGYRLVQEYFAFPEKFLFFELSGLDFSGGDEFELLFLLTAAVDKTLDPGKQALRLNCAPLINLFPQRLEPLSLDQTHYEYQLSGDHAAHKYVEIYRVESLTALRPGEAPRPVSPYFALDGFDRLEQQDYFYVTRRVDSALRSVPGTETLISFLDMRFSTQKPNNETIGGRALCTNRRLAEQLRVGDRIFLEGPGPIKTITVACKPTPHQSPVLLGGQPWAMISQLLLNHLSLSDNRYALGALKSMLRLHLGQASLSGTKQVDAITSLSTRPVVRPMQQDGRRVLAECLHIALKIDRSHFEGGSPLLFAEVLRRFFALYASVNTLTELSLETNDLKGTLKIWPPMAGTQTVL